MTESSIHRLEIRTRNLDQAVAFYTGAFDWAPSRVAADYVSLDPGGGPLIGVMQTPGEHVPTGICPYVTVPDITEASQTLSNFGGRILIPPTENPTEGLFSVGMDPNGNEIGMIQLHSGFQPGRSTGGQNPMVWMEIPYNVLKAGATFYQQMFDWTFLANEDIPNTAFYKGDDRPVGVSLISGPGAEHIRGSTSYIGVRSIGETRTRIQQLGGQVAAESGSSPGDGAFTLFGDLDNLRVGLYQTA
jgi:predicted enzyme related to lactoylglutathione lyase